MLDDRQTTESWQASPPVWVADTNRFGWRAYLGPHAFDSLMSETAIAARAREVLEAWLAARLHPAD